VPFLYTAWTIKHKPKSTNEIVGNKSAIKTLREWFHSWQKGTPKKRAAFLYGPPGIGKTVTVEALAHELQMELVEKNASDYRTEDAINRFAGLASQYGSLFGGKRIVLLDELDGLMGNADKGGVKAITNVVKTARCPIVLIANNAYNPRFRTLRSYCLLIDFKKPPAKTVLKHLQRINEREGIQSDENVLKFLAQRAEGDVRSAVNDFQALAQGKKQLKYDDVSWLAYRDRHESIFNVIKLIIYGRTSSGAKKAVNMADVDIDMLFEWIYENAPAHLNDPQDLVQAMDALAMADIFRGRIRASQNWSFMRYVIDYMTAGVAMARQNSKVSGWVPFKFPSRIMMLSRSKAKRAMRKKIGLKIRRKCHISANRASSEVLPYLRIIFKNNVLMAAGITRWLDLDEEMIDYIAESKSKTRKIIESLS
jgi:replication factor C large subunit